MTDLKGMGDMPEKSSMTEYIKVNFPLTEEEYISGNGEGMWVLVDPETKKAHDEDASGGRHFGVLDNDSVYYPDLKHGTVFPFEMRGNSRPVADFRGFLSKLNGISQEEKADLIRQIVEARCLGRVTGETI